MNVTLRTAIFISAAMHSAILIPLNTFTVHRGYFEHKTQVVVDYVVVNETFKQRERKGTELPRKEAVIRVVDAPGAGLKSAIPGTKPAGTADKLNAENVMEII